jgi:hypothetical protein
MTTRRVRAGVQNLRLASLYGQRATCACNAPIYRSPDSRSRSEGTFNQPIAVGSPGHQAVLDLRLGVQFMDQEQPDHQQQQRDGHTGEARRLPVGRFVILVVEKPGALLLHTDGYLTSFRGEDCKLQLRQPNEAAISRP